MVDQHETESDSDQGGAIQEEDKISLPFSDASLSQKSTPTPQKDPPQDPESQDAANEPSSALQQRVKRGLDILHYTGGTHIKLTTDSAELRDIIVEGLEQQAQQQKNQPNVVETLAQVDEGSLTQTSDNSQQSVSQGEKEDEDKIEHTTETDQQEEEIKSDTPMRQEEEQRDVDDGSTDTHPKSTATWF